MGYAITVGLAIIVIGVLVLSIIFISKKGKSKLLFAFIIGSVVLLAVIIPFLINESYKFGKWYITLWDAKDVLSFYGAVLSFCGTVILGALALWQNERMYQISKRMLDHEKKRLTPFLRIDVDKSLANTFDEHEIDLNISLKNETEGIINIIDVSDIHCDNMLSDNSIIIPFSRDWITYYSVIPNEILNINFFSENKKTEKKIVNFYSFNGIAAMCQLRCRFKIKLKYVNSKDIYEQCYEFYIYCLKGEKEKQFLINGVENKINAFGKCDYTETSNFNNLTGEKQND